MRYRLSAVLLVLLFCRMGGWAEGRLFGTDSTVRRSRDFNVVHYRLELSFDEKGKKVEGAITVTLTPLSGPLDSVVLDAVAMEIRSAKLATGQALEFHNRSPELAILLNRRWEMGETLAVRIAYSCKPEKGLYFIVKDSSGTAWDGQIWSQGEDMDNRYWFPCYDYPNDKATSEVIATVREEYTLLSNGRLIAERHDPVRKTRTFHWKEEKPHSSYLIMIAAGRYAITRDMYRNIPLLYYMYPKDSVNVQATFGNTAAMIRFFESETGVPYPWEKFAQIIIDEFMWGGMENTTAVTLNDATVVDSRSAADFPSGGVISHELAHQWWGDLVTCRDWRHLWLNEGFATYFEWLYTQASKGKDEQQYERIAASFGIRRNDRQNGRHPVVSSSNESANLYERGAWVLFMLRDLLGDEAFHLGLHAYLTRYSYACAETNELKLALEDATGQNLDWFFDQWLYKAGLPVLKVTKEWDDNARLLHLKVRQEQPVDSLTGIFRFPLWVEVTTARSQMLHKVWVEHAEETFTFPADSTPLMVIADKGYRLLKEMDFPKSEEEYRFQLGHASDVADRITAARSLAEDEGENARTALTAALHDPFWGVREAAITALSETKGVNGGSGLVEALRDENSRVRRSAVDAISRTNDGGFAPVVDSVARHDPSDIVVSTCIRTLAGLDTVRGAALAIALIDRPSHRDVVRRTALHTLQMLRTSGGTETALRYTEHGFDRHIRMLATDAVAAGGREVPAARARLRELLHDGDSGVRQAAVRGASAWHESEFLLILREMQKTETDSEVLDLLRKALTEGKGEGEGNE